MTSNCRLLELTALIHENTRQVDTYIRDNNLPPPSFDHSYPPVLDLPSKVDVARSAALEAISELQAHLLGPIGSIWGVLAQHSCLVSYHAVVRFGMAKAFPVDVTITIPELATKCGLDLSDTHRIMRHAVSQGIFHEPEPGVIAHSAVSQAIVTVPNTDVMMSSILDNMWSAAPRVVDGMVKWPGSEEPDQTAFNIASHTSDTFFDELAKNEKRAATFAGCMTWMQSGLPLRTSFAVEGYDWSVHKKVVDIGGSHGNIAREIVGKNPGMKVIVQDRPEVVESAPKDLTENVEWVAHDFFAEQPIKDADVYFYRWILHDWSDKYCIKILRALVPALRKGARVVLMEHILPEPGTLSPYQQRLVLGYDMVMKELFNAKERTEKEWRGLIRETHEDFKLLDVYTPKGSQLGFVVVEWEG